VTNVLIPVIAGVEATEDATPGCGCCVPPPDASQAEGRRQALEALQARRDALERRLQGLR
jgi:hypothetical protein